MQIILCLTLLIANIGHTAGVIGSYELDSSQSKMVLFTKNLKMHGVMSINENFSESKITAASDQGTFESTRFVGDLGNFEVHGQLTYNGILKFIKLKGKYFGASQSLSNIRRAAFTLTHKDFFMRAIISKNPQTSTAIYKKVRDIIR